MTQEQANLWNSISANQSFGVDNTASINPDVAKIMTKEKASGGVIRTASDVFEGIGKGAIESVKGASSFGERMLQGIGKLFGAKYEDKTAAEELIPEELTTATNKAQDIGKTIEKVGEVLLPASKISKLQKGANLFQKALTEGVIGAGYQAIQSGKADADTLRAAGVSAAVPVVGQLLSAGIKQIPRIVTYATGMPEDMLKSYIQNASKVNNYVREGKGIKDALNTLQDAQGTLRKQLTREYGEGLEMASKAFEGKTVQFSDRGVKNLTKFVNRFGAAVTEYIDDAGNAVDINLAQPTVKDSVELMKNINALQRDAIGTERNIITKLGAEIKKNIIDSFGGKKGLVDTFVNNYSTEKEILDFTEDIIARGKENPKALTAALTKLDTIFRDNKEAYVNIIKKIEDATGTDILNQVIAGELKSNPVSGSQNFLKVLLEPLFKWGTRVAGGIVETAQKVPGKETIKRIGEEIGESKLIQRGIVSGIANQYKE